jgi:uncharacterized protein YaaR (DUF327 family)
MKIRQKTRSAVSEYKEYIKDFVRMAQISSVSILNLENARKKRPKISVMPQISSLMLLVITLNSDV